MRIFLDDTDYRVFTFVLGEVVEEYDLECWNYCLMPNHYHLTLRPRRANLSDAMRRLNSKYAQAWNRRHQRVGHVFQGRFKDQIVQNNEYLFALCRYVALNPVRAQLATNPEDWAWGSYQAILGRKECQAFLSPECTLSLFGPAHDGSRQTRFDEFVRATPRDETPYDRFHSNERIVGDRQFKTTVAGRAVPSETLQPPPLALTAADIAQL